MVPQLHYPPHREGGSSAISRGALLRPNKWGDCSGHDGCSSRTCGRLRCRELITIRGGSGVNHYRMNIITEWMGGGDSGGEVRIERWISWGIWRCFGWKLWIHRADFAMRNDLHSGPKRTERQVQTPNIRFPQNIQILFIYPNMPILHTHL